MLGLAVGKAISVLLARWSHGSKGDGQRVQ